MEEIKESLTEYRLARLHAYIRKITCKSLRLNFFIPARINIVFASLSGNYVIENVLSMLIYSLQKYYLVWNKILIC